ncbi:hypothetical protein GCM10009843_22210 [Nocardioides bigeumensis]|uniref:Uncharacterized protein n=1 Tax=Nocardioides bigeumensis TaxID=433657 RepID=A0ABP5K4P3_9ACTN
MRGAVRRESGNNREDVTMLRDQALGAAMSVKVVKQHERGVVHRLDRGRARRLEVPRLVCVKARRR